MRTLSSILLFFILLTADLFGATAGRWDSSIYNLIEHPRTVALRIEVIDSRTRLPIPSANVRFRGTYRSEPRTSRHPDGPAEAQTREFDLSISTNDKGIAVAAFGWQKDYPWSRGIDEIEKVQTIEVRHSDYGYVQMPVPFESFLEVGQRPDSTTQEPVIFERFEQSWHAQVGRGDVIFCVLNLGTDFPDFNNTNSSRPEFFKRIMAKNWGQTFDTPRNWFSKGDHPQSLCGPYFIYLIEIPMDRIKTDIVISASSMPDSEQAGSKTEDEKPEIDRTLFRLSDPPWQVDFLEGLEWGMEGEEVERVLSRKGIRLNVINAYQYNDSGRLRTIHQAEVPGTFIYGRIQVDGVKMDFTDQKLVSINFGSARESDADSLFAQCETMFGPGLEYRWEHNDADKIRDPLPGKSSKRYFRRTSVESRVDYGWDYGGSNRYIRFGSVNLKDYTKSSTAHTNIEYDAYINLLFRIREEGKISCPSCYGRGRCRKCSGKGTVDDYKHHKCPYPACGGRGWYVPRGSGGQRKNCTRCRGQGSIRSVDKETISCSRCRGDGKCHECKGAGEIKKQPSMFLTKGRS